MKVLLICPVPPQTYWPRGIFRNTSVPTGVGHMASLLKSAGHDVRVYVREEQLCKLKFDWDAAELHVRRAIGDFAPDVVGFSVCTPMVSEAGRLAAATRELLGDSPMIVAGGSHVTALPARTLRECPDLDAVVVGEGERTLLELVEAGPGPDVAGVVWRDGETIRTNAPRSPEADLDSLPPIDYSMFDMGFYTAPSRWLIRWMEIPVTNIRTSRGCTNRCAFCAGHLVAGLGLRFHSVGYVVERMKHAVDSFHVRGIHFEDDTLGADRDRLMDLCEAIRSAGLDRRVVWDGCLRVDQSDAELLATMKKAGCVQIEYGFECGSDNMLRQLGKSATVEQNRRAVRLTHEAGLRIFADIMIGLPGETAADVAKTEEFLRWAKPEVITAGTLVPLPGTGIFNQIAPEIRDRLDWGAYAYMDCRKLGLNVTAMSDDEFADVRRRFLRGFIAPWVLRQVLRDTAADNHRDRKRLQATLRKFRFRHPIRYAGLPA